MHHDLIALATGGCNSMRPSALALSLAVVVAASLGGCATLPPGSTFPKLASAAFAQPEDTRVGRKFADAARDHPGHSAFRLITIGAEGFAARMQMIDAAERTLDLQYFIVRGDTTGRLLTTALLRAADRGVRLRVLLDDGETAAGDEQVLALAAHPQVEIRIFNPFAYRGNSRLVRAVEFVFSVSRLDYRMHNKLFVADNASALVGGRNIGDQYFQIDPDEQFADDDVFVVGPAVQKLSNTFDEFWNDARSIPVAALQGGKPSEAALVKHRALLAEQWQQAQTNKVPHVTLAASGEPWTGMIEGRLPLVWSAAQVVSDSPAKKDVAGGSRIGRLMYEPIAQAARAATSELLLITPYFVPTAEEMQLLTDLRQRNVRVRILTNSLESNNQLAAHSGYMHYRVPLLQAGVEVHEVRALLGNTRGSGQTAAISAYGNYGLHAKMFVIDRQKLFIGSMNIDQRSVRLNTEVGLIIDNAALAAQTATRFEAMTQPANAYRVLLQAQTTGPPRLLWRTQEAGKTVEYLQEPARSEWQRLGLNLLSLLPLDGEL